MTDLAFIVATYVCFRLIEKLADLPTRYQTNGARWLVGLVAAGALVVCGFEWIGIFLNVLQAAVRLRPQ